MIPHKYKKFNPVYFDRGKRSIVYTFSTRNKNYAIKIKNPKSNTINRLRNEAVFLKLLNKHRIGPKLVDSGKNYIVYEFVEGKFLRDIKLNKKDIIEILKQCRKLDKLGINKKEMHHPLKHIIFNIDKVTMIDFERCYKTKKPKNVTQFIQYLISRCSAQVPVYLIRKYKNDQSDKNFTEIIKYV